MKKSTKSIPPRAPAASSAAPVKAAALKKSTAPASVAAKSVPAARTAAPASKPAVAPAPKPAAISPATLIKAKVDVGFGNTLFLRGKGASLSWDKGVPLTNSSADEWAISLREVNGPIQFKFLINDEQWSSGSDFSAAPGAKLVVTPSF